MEIKLSKQEAQKIVFECLLQKDIQAILEKHFKGFGIDATVTVTDANVSQDKSVNGKMNHIIMLIDDRFARKWGKQEIGYLFGAYWQDVFNVRLGEEIENCIINDWDRFKAIAKQLHEVPRFWKENDMFLMGVSNLTYRLT